MILRAIIVLSLIALAACLGAADARFLTSEDTPYPSTRGVR